MCSVVPKPIHKNFLKNFQKRLDKLLGLCYNKSTKRKEVLTMNRLSTRILQLSITEIEDLKSRCRICLILGGTRSCSCSSLLTPAEKLGTTPKDLLKWYPKIDKNFIKKISKKA
jgi:hypothetical protein